MCVCDTHITVLPLADEAITQLCDEVAAVELLATGGEFWVRLQLLRPHEHQLGVEHVEVGMDGQLLGTTHGQKLTATPQARIVI